MQIDMDNERLLLNTQVHGVREGARFAVYPSGSRDITSVEKCLALVEVEQRGATDSRAKIITKYNRGVIEKGAQSVLIDPVVINLKRMVRLVYQNEITIPSTIKKSQKEALEQIRNIIPTEGKGFLESAAENKDKAHFQVAINKWRV